MSIFKRTKYVEESNKVQKNTLEPEYKNNYGIRKRFQIIDDRNYFTEAKIENHFSEIVTLDFILCELKHTDNDSNDYIANIKTYEDILKYRYTDKEQIIRSLAVNEEISNHFDNGFIFCGYDIMDYFDSNSWVTNCGIKYDFDKYNYTEFGLLKTYEETLKWILDHRDDDQELLNGEYTIYAIWRLI